MNAELEDYIGSGYWPGNPKTLGIFFTTSFLKLYFHLKNYLPGSSEYGLLKALGAFSADAGRVFFMNQRARIRRVKCMKFNFI
jgi:hypothetical protein